MAKTFRTGLLVSMLIGVALMGLFCNEPSHAGMKGVESIDDYYQQLEQQVQQLNIVPKRKKPVITFSLPAFTGEVSRSFADSMIIEFKKNNAILEYRIEQLENSKVKEIQIQEKEDESFMSTFSHEY